MSYVLHVRVVEARDIAKMDTFGKSDPYIILQMGGQQKKTTVKQNTQSPHWNESFTFNVTDMNGMLHFLMRDQDVRCDDDMAKLEISLNSIRYGQVVDQWYPMRPVKRGKKGGDLHLVLHLADRNDAPFVTKAQAPNFYPAGAPGFVPPPQGGMYGAVPGMYPPQQPMYPQQPGMMPGAPGMYPQQPGMMPGAPGMYPPQQPGMMPGAPGMYPPQQPGMMPGAPGMYPQPGYYR